MSNNQLAMVMIFAGGFLFGGVATLLLRWWRGKMPKKETYADFICWSLTEEPRAWVANEFRVLNAGRKINLWVANGTTSIRDESNPSSFSYREKRRIWRAVKRNSHLRAMLPVDVEAAETEPEAPEPPKPAPYASARGSKPPAPWATKDDVDALSEAVGRIIDSNSEMADYTDNWRTHCEARLTALENQRPKPTPEPVQIYESPGAAEGYCLYHKGRTYMRYGGGAWYEPMHVEVVPACSKYIDPESPKYAELRSSWERWRAPEPLAPGVRVWRRGQHVRLLADGCFWGRESDSNWYTFEASERWTMEHCAELHGHERESVVRDWMNRGNV